MSNLDLTILDIFRGDTPVLKIMKGDIKKWPLIIYTVTTNLTNITSNAPTTIDEDASLSVTLTVNTGHYIDSSSVVVMMGSTDITSTAYNNGVITIASVTGNVSITASTMFDAEVEYLQSDGNVYIDTGVKVASSTKFDIDLSVETPPTDVNYYLFGGRISASEGCMYLFRNSSGNWKWYFGTKNSTVSGVSVNRVRCQNIDAARHIYVNSGHVAVTSQTFSTNNNFYLFAVNLNGGVNSTKPAFPIYSAKLYSSGTLVRDYIPVRKNGVGYLFDKKNKVLYGNANSSGAFTYGNDVTI